MLFASSGISLYFKGGSIHFRNVTQVPRLPLRAGGVPGVPPCAWLHEVSLSLVSSLKVISSCFIAPLAMVGPPGFRSSFTEGAVEGDELVELKISSSLAQKF